MPKTDVWRPWNNWNENVGGNSRNFFFNVPICFEQESASNLILADLDAFTSGQVLQVKGPTILNNLAASNGASAEQRHNLDECC